MGTMAPLAVSVLLGMVSLANGYAGFSPTQAKVTETGDQKVYTGFFEGSSDMVAQWEYRFQTIFPKDADEITLNQQEGSASLTLSGFHEVVSVVLYENQRDMSGSRVHFMELDGQELLPKLDVSLSSDVVHFPGQSLYVNTTILQPTPASVLNDFEVSAEFFGVDRSNGSVKIIKQPSLYLGDVPCNKVSQEGNTYVYEVTVPNAEGILFVQSKFFASPNRPAHPAIFTRAVVEVLPEGSVSLFEDNFFGVKSNKYKTGELPCASHFSVPCLIECEAIGPNIQGIELYYENNSLAYAAREDIRHGDNFMRSRFSFDDKTVGRKGQLTCQATSESRTVNDSFGLIVYEHINVTSFGVQKEGDERIFHCSATGWPEPKFKVIVSSRDLIFDHVDIETSIEDGVKTATYRYNYSDEVTLLLCQAQTEYSFGYKRIDNPE